MFNVENGNENLYYGSCGEKKYALFGKRDMIIVAK
jgi:hypothetical protein